VRAGFVLVVDDAAESVHIITGKDEIKTFLASHTGEQYTEFKNNGGWFLYAARGTIVVPLCNAAGDIGNLQFIFTDKKQFIKNGPKSGLFHFLGSITSHTPAILIAEGYATAATLHEATGYPVAMAIDCGNLLPVAQALRGVPPAHSPFPIVVCGDDDAATEGNPGKTKAEEAAQAVAGVAVFPVFEVAA